MAFLQPENIPSRNDLPKHLQQIARALRDALPDEVTVWLDRTAGGDAAALRREFDLGGPAPDADGSEPYLVILDPEAGIAVLEAPSATRTRRHLLRNRKIEVEQLREDIARRIEELRRGLRAPAVRSLPVAHVLALPELRRKDLPDSQSLTVMTMEDFAPEALRPALQRIMGHRVRSLSNAEEIGVRATIRPEIIIGDTAQSATAEQGPLFGPPDDTERIRALDRQQERLARHISGGYRLIRGVAGSGKTLILTHRAKHFGALLPDWRILLTCYNRALAAALAKEVAAVRNVRVRTVDGLARELLEDAGQLIRRHGEPDFEARRREAREIATALNDTERFDIVLVDEAQDLGSSGLDLAWAMLKRNRDHFVIALDSAQRVYRRHMTWNPPGMTARGRATVLRINYRNTREILDPALEILRARGVTGSNDVQSDDLDVLVMPEDAVRHGRIAPILTCADIDAEVRTIVEAVRELRQGGADPEQIAILSGSRELRNKVLNRVPETVDAGESSDKGASARGRIRVATLQLLKGLEFRHVIVGGANHVWVTEDEEQAQDEQRRRLLYVGMTRATETLTVTHSGEGLMNSFRRLPALDPDR